MDIRSKQVYFPKMYQHEINFKKKHKNLLVYTLSFFSRSKKKSAVYNFNYNFEVFVLQIAHCL